MICYGLEGAGDTVVITAGVPVGEAGTTNLMKVHIVEELKCPPSLRNRF